MMVDQDQKDRVMRSIGFMQGRLSPLIEGKIQAFPWEHWRAEFQLAEEHGFKLMEWTLDQERLYENPLMTPDGRSDIKALIARHSVEVLTLTGNCFMQAPFYKAQGKEREQLTLDLQNILQACGKLHMHSILIPLVDAGRLENISQENALLDILASLQPLLEEAAIKISFESDYTPEKFAALIDRLDERYFGITFDIGDSAAMGHDHADELMAYGNRIINVHVKDRLLGGTTVPLGTGNARLPQVTRAIISSGYRGNFILQTARATDGEHVNTLVKYRGMLESWLTDSTMEH